MNNKVVKGECAEDTG